MWSVGGERQLWVVPAESGVPERLTYGNGITFFRWAPNGQRLIYGADDDGNEQPAFFLIARNGRFESVALPPVVVRFRRQAEFLEQQLGVSAASP